MKVKIMSHYFASNLWVPMESTDHWANEHLVELVGTCWYMHPYIKEGGTCKKCLTFYDTCLISLDSLDCGVSSLIR